MSFRVVAVERIWEAVRVSQALWCTKAGDPAGVCELLRARYARVPPSANAQKRLKFPASLDLPAVSVYYCVGTPIAVDRSWQADPARLKRRGCLMQFSIEPNNGVPIYEQLVRQVKYAVAEGVVVPGQVIPSVREMAKLLAVNPNTVQRAYLQLQDEDVLHALRGRGMAVSDGAKRRCVAYRHELLAERLTTVVAEALRSGLEPEQLRTMFDTSLETAATRGEN